MSYLAERARRAELTEAVTKTAVRYPHLSASAIGRMFGVGLVEVSGVLQAANLDRPRRNSGDEFTAESVAADRAAGLKPVAIARKYDVSEYTIKQLIPREEEIPVTHIPDAGEVQKTEESTTRKRHAAAPTPREIAELRVEGLSWHEIARRLKRGVATVHDVAQRSVSCQIARNARQSHETHANRTVRP